MKSCLVFKKGFDHENLAGICNLQGRLFNKHSLGAFYVSACARQRPGHRAFHGEQNKVLLLVKLCSSLVSLQSRIVSLSCLVS